MLMLYLLSALINLAFILAFFFGRNIFRKYEIIKEFGITLPDDNISISNGTVISILFVTFTPFANTIIAACLFFFMTTGIVLEIINRSKAWLEKPFPLFKSRNQ